MSSPTSYTISPALQAQLDVLREAYAAKLDDKISQICNEWSAFMEHEAGTEKTEVLENLHRITHTLAGSGATFGFPAVSLAARRAEKVMKSLVQGGPSVPIAEDQVAEIEAALRELRTSSREQEGLDSFSKLDQNPAEPNAVRQVFLFSDDPQGMPAWAPSIETFGYELHYFRNPAALKAAWLEKAPAAVIADCQSEPMQCSSDNVMLSAVLNDMRREAEVSVPLIWTCHTSDLRTRLQGVRLGGAAFFSHPVDVDSLLVKLDDLTALSAPEPFRILIVDDEPSLGRLYSVVLRQAGMETLVVSEPMDVMAPLVDFRPDVILMDVFMPGCSGVELASVIRQQEAYIGIPIMFLSVETDVSRQMAAMRQGGDDFLIKPVQPIHLVSAVTTRATRARALRNLMVRDSLTGLLNHTKTKEQLGIELDRARRLGHPVSLAMLDIDNFKVVNDTYGHATGDRVLRSLSRMLGQRLRQTDVIGRYGGEEFAVILNGSNADDARKKLESVRVSFSHLAHYSDGREFRVTFSAGIASSPPWNDATQISAAADRALYEAKRSGRNRTCLSDNTAAWIAREPLK